MGFRASFTAAKSSSSGPYNPITAADTAEIWLSAPLGLGNINTWTGSKAGVALGGGTVNVVDSSGHYVEMDGWTTPLHGPPGSLLTGDTGVCVVARMFVRTTGSTMVIMSQGTNITVPSVFSAGVGFNGGGRDFWSGGGQGSGGDYGFADTAPGTIVVPTGFRTVTWRLDTAVPSCVAEIIVDGASLAVTAHHSGCLVGNFGTDDLYLGAQAGGTLPLAGGMRAIAIMHGASPSHLADMQAYMTALG